MASFAGRLRDLLGSGENLPTLPEVVLRLHAAHCFRGGGRRLWVVTDEHRRGAQCLHAAETLVHGSGMGLPVEGPPDLVPSEELAVAGVPPETRACVGAALDQIRESAASLIAPG